MPPQQSKPRRKKISETFLRFAAPILSTMPEEAAPSEIESVLRVPCAISNALVFDHATGTQDYVTRVRETLAHSPAGTAVAEHLIDRKRRPFRDDNLLICRYRVTQLGRGEIDLWAEDRDPYSAIENQGRPNKPGRAYG